MSQKLSHQAVDWFVLNESDQTETWGISQRWEEWCTERVHRAEYVDVLQLTLDLRELPAPAPVSRRELLEDVAAEESATPGTPSKESTGKRALGAVH